MDVEGKGRVGPGTILAEEALDADLYVSDIQAAAVGDVRCLRFSRGMLLGSGGSKSSKTKKRSRVSAANAADVSIKIQDV